MVVRHRIRHLPRPAAVPLQGAMRARQAHALRTYHNGAGDLGTDKLHSRNFWSGER